MQRKPGNQLSTLGQVAARVFLNPAENPQSLDILLFLTEMLLFTLLVSSHYFDAKEEEITVTPQIL